jgi:hypothetical protein
MYRYTYRCMCVSGRIGTYYMHIQYATVVILQCGILVRDLPPRLTVSRHTVCASIEFF